MPTTTPPPTPSPKPPTGKQVEGALTLLAALVIAGVIKYRRKWRPSSGAHGTARFADKRDMKRAGLLAGKGLLLGRTLDTSDRLLHLSTYTHLAIFAPTSAGKGVSLLFPWLLTWNRGSLIINDPKGELYQGTAHVRRAMGQKVVVLAPFWPECPDATTFNPLDLIPRGEACIPHCRAAAAAMVVRGEEKEQHWNDRCSDVLTAVLCFVCTSLEGKERSLAAVRQIVSQPDLFAGCAAALQKMGGLFANLAGSMLSLEDKERSGVISTCHRHTNNFDDPAILPAVMSEWDATELLDGNVALFLVLPGWAVESQVRWLRIVIASALRLVGQRGMNGGKELLMLLDEAALLGHMQPLEQGLTLLRSSGLRMAFFFQSLGQLKESFAAKESVLLDNVQQIYFGVQSLETAKRVSEMLGTYTETAESYSENSSSSEQAGAFGERNQGVTYSTSRNVSVSVHARALLTPDEVLNLPGNVLIAFLRGAPPVICRRVLYYSDPFFRRFSRLRQIAKRAVLSLLVGVLFAVLVNLPSLTKGGATWQPPKNSPDPSGNRSTTWPQKR